MGGRTEPATHHAHLQLIRRAKALSQRVLPWFAISVAPLFIYHQVFCPFDDSRAHFWGDTTGAYWPDLAFFWRCLQQWQLPLWNPDDRGGFPFAFDPQPGVLYPINWLFVVIGLLLNNFPYELFQWKIFLHLSIAGLGWYVWLALRHSKPACLVGAVGATFGCFTLQHVHFGLIWPIAFVPWFLFALDHWLVRPRLSVAMGMAATLGAMVAAGSPPSALYALIVCTCYATWPVARTITTCNGRNRRQMMVTGVAAIVVAMVLSAPVIVGTARLTAASVLEKRTFEDYVNFGRLDPSDLFAIVYPTTSGSLLYTGVTLVGLALVGTVMCWRRSLTWVSLLLVVLGMLLTLGDHTPVLRWASIVLPPLRFFRLPFRYLYLTQIGVGVLAALGTDALVAHRRWRRFGALGLLAGLVLTSVALWHDPPQLPRSRLDLLSNDLAAAATWLALTFVLCVIAVSWRRAKHVMYVVPLLTLADLTDFVPHTHVLRPGLFELPQYVSNSAIAQMQREADQYRVWDEFGLGFRSGSRIGVRDLRGYMDPLRLADYETMLVQFSRAPDLLRRWNVRWALTAPHAYVGTSHNRVPVSGLGFGRRLEPHVVEVPNPRARALFTTNVALAQTNAAAFEALVQNPTRAKVQVLVDDGLQSAEREWVARLPAATVEPDVPATLVRRGINSLTFTVNAPQTGWFVVNEAYFPGWLAWVDGKAVVIHKVDGWIRGLPVSAGLHTVQMRFRPSDWLLWASLAVTTWFVLGTGAVLVACRRGRYTSCGCSIFNTHRHLPHPSVGFKTTTS